MGSREIARLKDLTANSTEKSGPRPWEIEQYIYKEPRDDQRSSHDDPRLEFALQSLSQHPDDFIPSDDDPQSLHPAVGIGPTTDLSASASFASDQGTLAGGSCFSSRKVHRNRAQELDEAFASLATSTRQREKEALDKYNATNDFDAYNENKRKIVIDTRKEFKRIINS